MTRRRTVAILCIGSAAALAGCDTDNVYTRGQPFREPPALAIAPSGNYMDEQEAALRRQLLDSGVSVRREGDNLVLNMQDDILFDVDSDYVHPEARDLIRSVALVLRRYGRTHVDVNGYADTAGPREHNDGLSQARAEAVAGELVRYGVSPERIAPHGFGEAGLRVPTPDGVLEPRNRRVEIVLEPTTG